MWQAAGAGLLLVIISVMVLRTSRRHPYLMVGWLWYLGTLVPVIGLVQAGVQAMADRFTYVPLIGLFIMMAWWIPDLLAGWRHRRIAFSLVASATISISMIFSWAQIQLWKNGLTLYEHTLGVTHNNWLIHNNLGLTLMEGGRLTEAVRHYSEALRINPDYVEAHNNLGIALARQGELQKTVKHFSEAVRIKPEFAKAHNNLGIALARQGRLQEAVKHFSKAVRINPDYADARNNLRRATRQIGKSPEFSNSLASP